MALTHTFFCPSSIDLASHRAALLFRSASVLLANHGIPTVEHLYSTFIRQDAGCCGLETRVPACLGPAAIGPSVMLRDRIEVLPPIEMEVLSADTHGPRAWHRSRTSRRP